MRLGPYLGRRHNHCRTYQKGASATVAWPIGSCLEIITARFELVTPELPML